ncbi:hypothetical protein CMI42_03235 [Candidatus Pacearchaeota archaeon]|nr:hypothetical protein [Candidatus Pacearchaeota archaeon]|tara:strand:- start:1623 stop:2369 length:747 start_codon:yes stop_codon:yes gene_type:complete
MKKKIAVIGKGKFGSQIATILKDKYGSEYLFPTRKDKNKTDKDKTDFPNISINNIKAVENSDIILLLTHPKDASEVLQEIDSVINNRLIVNFTSKELDSQHPLLNVACSPVIEGRITTILYNPNEKVKKKDIEMFAEIFKPLAKNFMECDNSVAELGLMSRIRAHIFNYYRDLLKEGHNGSNLKSHFDHAIESLLNSEGIENQTQKAQTKGGFTEEINNLYNEDNLFEKLVKKEKDVINSKIKSIQEN